MLLSPFFLYVPMLRYRLYFVGLYLCALLYIAAGINHFVNAEMYLRTMPPYLPAHEALVALSGVIEIVLGVALVLRPKTRLRVWAAWGIVLLLIAVFPASSDPSHRLGLGLYAPDASAPQEVIASP